MTQNAKLLRWLETHDGCTTAEATVGLHCYRLSERIRELEALGFRISHSPETTEHGARVIRYRLLSASAPSAPNVVADATKVAGAEPHERLITTTGRSADGKRTYELRYTACGPGPGWPPDQDAMHRRRRA